MSSRRLQYRSSKRRACTYGGNCYDDLPDCTAMWSDPNVTRFIGGKPLTEQQTWMRLLSYVGQWALMGFGYWVIEEKASGNFVGEVGCADFKRDSAPSMKGSPELGFALASRFHRKAFNDQRVLFLARERRMKWRQDHLN